jgi:molybdopterin molybdotransferase
MDGYAVAIDDRSERFRVVAEIQAGAGADVRIGPGECARIFTGAAIPTGASQVIMQEDARREGDFMIPTRRGSMTHVRRRGEDVRQGTRVLAAGTRLGAAEVALLAQLGVTAPLVSAPVRVVHFTTGDELVDPSQTPAVGQIRDSNSTLLAALLAERGATLTMQERCGDTLEALVTAIESRASESWDLLLISGGASVGDYDFGVRALEHLGFTVHFRKINLRPGKPLIFATRGAQLAFVIPGNPVSHLVTFHVAIAHAIERLEGSAGNWSLIQTKVSRELPADARETWWPARMIARDGRLIAEPLAWQSSGDLVGIAGVNALLRIAPDTPVPTDGEAPCLVIGPFA